MKLSNSHWKAVLSTLALTAALPSAAQQSTGDPFLDAVLAEEAENKTQPRQNPAAAEQRPNTAAKQTGFSLPGMEEADRELGPQTGLFFNDVSLEGKKVVSVSIRYAGSRSIPDSRLYDLLQTRRGSKYSAMRVNADLERLIENGMVAGDARVLLERRDGGVAVTFEVHGAKVLGGIGFTGNHRFDDDELRDEIEKMTSNRAITDKGLAETRAAIIKAYQEAGYPDTRVTWRIVPTSRPEYNDVIFDIVEGREMSMNSIVFRGNTVFDRAQLHEVMHTKERGLFTWFTKSGRIDRERIEEDLREIEKLYRNYGYLRARITKVNYYDISRKIGQGRQKLRMEINIYEGPRYRVRKVGFSNTRVYTPAELEPGLSMIGGDIYSLQKVTDDVEMIRKYYGARGYADAIVQPVIDEVGVDENGVHLVDIRYDINEGARSKVGRIQVRGNTTTKTKVILRELPLQPGDNMSSVDLDIAAKRLTNLGYFVPESVSVTQSASNIPGYRDINIDVQEGKTGQLTLGVAFSSVQNVYLYATVVQTNFDIMGFTNGVFTGGGQRLTVSANVGTEYKSASIYLLEPWFLDRKLALGNELYYADSTYMSDFYEQTNFGYAISLQKALNEFSSVKLEYRLEHYKIDPEPYAPQFFRDNGGDYDRSHLRLSYKYDSRDAEITPRKGGSFEAYLGYSGPGSTVETWTAGFGGSYYYNAALDSIFSVNYGFETVRAVDDNDVVPIFERCYLGGPNNLRGFRYRDVGMVNSALAGDETMGGRNSAYAQFEVTVPTPIAETMRFAMFFDVGFVNDSLRDMNSDIISADAGIGLRLNLPMGPVAIDYAIPVRTGNAIDDGGQVQFYINYKY
ncbi:MAG TPA: outer membrane protein assembly factor BamA [Candidatus Akkermansia intestinigallinarum]|uniref:Outer membrane protein assembly factor BamA n=1 Tax=Candidatus Akkermansia intestinigallinarum TaxID=2838431 RepID=A0A9D1VA19_9BACT|nr:outer membrane protein assembly factor BamA [Candidatus Akkermansia intestinigallinarum]